MQASASNRKDVRAAEKRAESDAVRLMIINREVVCGLMQISNGREWVWNRLEEASVFQTDFSPDQSIHAFNAGRRIFGVSLFNDIMLYCPDKFNLMMGEAHDRRSAHELGRSPNPDGGVEGPSDRGARGDSDYDPLGDGAISTET